jgi:murein DD-endopeptidase MepM/ murein hydrolase activator NlpD
MMVRAIFMTASRALPDDLDYGPATEVSYHAARRALPLQPSPARHRAKRGLIEVSRPHRALRAIVSPVESTLITTRIIKDQPKSKTKRFGLIALVAPVGVGAAVATMGFFPESAIVAPANDADAALSQAKQAAAPVAQTAEALTTDSGVEFTAADLQSVSVTGNDVVTSANLQAADALQVDAQVKEEKAAKQQAEEEAKAQAAARAKAKTAAGKSAQSGKSAEAGYTPITVAPGEFIKPTKGGTSSTYGWRNDPFTGQMAFHEGTDIVIGCGAEVFASKDGVVTFSGYQGGLGNYIEVNHGAVTTGYAHLQKSVVSAGQQVKQGQLIGYVGSTGRSTGCHLHFAAIDSNGIVFNAMNLVK